MKIAIIGSGAYGSYAASMIAELHPDWEVHIYEVGNHEIKDQDTMGLCSEMIGSPYEALTKGRYFGFGGATAKWGGQILTFTENDFKNPSCYQKEIVELNKKYKRNIFKKVGIENNYVERLLPNGMFTKTGVWLDYFHRNLFKLFKVERYKNVMLHPNYRVTRILLDGKKVKGFEAVNEGKTVTVDGYDRYFLTTGAFETSRILMMSGIQDKTNVEFSDHIVKKVYKIKKGTKVGPVDFRFSIKNFSFITTRIIGEKDGVSFFLYPVFNDEFPFFKNLKKFLFGKKDLAIVGSILKDIPNCIAFVWDFFVLRKLFVYKNEWYLCLHLENQKGNGRMMLSDKMDKFCQPGLAVDFHINKETEDRFNNLSDMFEEQLKSWGVDYERLHEKVHTEKFEDEYHPFGIYSDFESVDDYFDTYENMLVVHSGVLPRAGGINSTAAAFPLLEEYIRNRIN